MDSLYNNTIIPKPPHCYWEAPHCAAPCEWGSLSIITTTWSVFSITAALGPLNYIALTPGEEKALKGLMTSRSIQGHQQKATGSRGDRCFTAGRCIVTLLHAWPISVNTLVELSGVRRVKTLFSLKVICGFESRKGSVPLPLDPSWRDELDVKGGPGSAFISSCVRYLTDCTFRSREGT